MKREEGYDVLLSENADALIEKLEMQLEEEYDEYVMLTLCRAYLVQGEEKKAKKLFRRLKMLFPAGEYIEAEEELFSTINQEQSSLLATLNVGKTGKVREKKVLDTIKEYFADVVGMESVQHELDKFYKMIRFQKERKQREFEIDLLKSSHFIVSGERGSGKTLVGEIIGTILCDFGVRTQKQVIKLEAGELSYAYEDNRIDGVRRLFDKVSNATVIIENIQNLWKSEVEQYREKEIYDLLEKVMRERKSDLSIILTGSREAVRKLLSVNSTIQDILQGTIDISDYSTLELVAIGEKIAKKKSLLIHDSAKKVFMEKIDAERVKPDFMNGITINRILEDAAGKMAERYFENSDSSEAAMVYLKPDDFDKEWETESLEELLAQLDALTGLHSVKEEIRKRIEGIIISQKARSAGAERKEINGTLHMLFLGNPGTGKTTVARMLGKIYKQLGILPRGSQLVECSRANLVGMYQGHTANLVRQKAKEAMGGVLFIDEAYALRRDKNDTFGQEAVDELMTVLENYKDNMMVIFAGYQKEMEIFLKSNSGFTSRIPKQIVFADYSVDEMKEIFLHMVNKANMKIEKEAVESLQEMLTIKSRIPDFGNARGVRNLFDEVLECMNERVTKLHMSGVYVDKSQYDTITIADIAEVMGKRAEGEKTIEELMEELEELTGLSSVKVKVQEMIDEIQVKEYMKAQGMKVEEGHGTLHLIFKGNAGTGKTTMARLLGKIYKKLGVLQKDIFVEVSRKDLVAEYLGKTAKLVNEKIDEAEGGILFIDEAYMLMNGERDQFGQEAIGTLVTELENRRDRLMVIMAGYSDKMDEFLEANQGLASRLSNEIIFEDYTVEELVQIFRYMIMKNDLKEESGLEEVICDVIEKSKNTVKDFGNARGVRNLYEKVLRKKNTRIAAQIRKGIQLDAEEMMIIKKEDFCF